MIVELVNIWQYTLFPLKKYLGKETAELAVSL